MDGCKVVQLIECTIRRRGKGTEDSLIRVVREYYTLDGQKVAEVDPVNQFEDGTVKAEGE